VFELEGEDIYNNNSIEQQYPEKKKGRISFLVLGIIIGLILGMVISPFIMDMNSEDKSEIPIYQHYSKSTGEHSRVYRNEKLNVTITKWYNYVIEGYCYHAEWIDVYGYYNDTSQYYGSPLLLHDAVLTSADKLSENQLKWFDYMLHKIIT
jgi:hypothetical protein